MQISLTLLQLRLAALVLLFFGLGLLEALRYFICVLLELPELIVGLGLSLHEKLALLLELRDDLVPLQELLLDDLEFLGIGERIFRPDDFF